MYNAGSSSQPDYPAALASLQHMDIDHLKEILHNEDKFDEFIKDLPQIKSLDAEKEIIMASNKSLAEYNISQEPLVKDEKAKLLEKFEKATSLAEEVKNIKAQIDAQSGKMNPDSLLVLLEASSQEAEEESETMVDLFMNQTDGDLEEFLEGYKDKRKLAHLRRIKVDKMRELLAKKQQLSTTPSRPAPPPPGGQLPYPAAAFPGYPPLPAGFGGYPQMPASGSAYPPPYRFQPDSAYR